MQFKGIKFNGTQGHYNDFFGNKKIKIKANSASFYKTIQPFEILMLQEIPDLVLAEIVVFRGKECYTIIEKSAFDEELQEYYGKKQKLVKKHFFDTADGLWIGSEEIVTSKDTRGDYISYIYYDDFREINGILFPLIKTKITPNKTDAFVTTAIEFDAPLTNQDFESEGIPPVVAALKKMPAATNTNNYALNIVGKWAEVLIAQSTGEEKKVTNTLHSEYKANGDLFLWDGNKIMDFDCKFYWSINRNILTIRSVCPSGRENKDEYEILSADKTMLVMKSKNDDGTYSTTTAKRLE